MRAHDQGIIYEQEFKVINLQKSSLIVIQKRKDKEKKPKQ